MTVPHRPAVPVPPGYRVGRWEVGDHLASGAFAAVYTGRPVDDGGTGPAHDAPREVALKFLPTGTRTPRQLRHLAELVEREVQLLSELRHPRLIRMHEVLTVDDPAEPELDGATVLVLERAEESLETLLLRCSPGLPQQGPDLLVQVCEGLVQLHRAGWVHGDLKPGNVLLMPDGSVRLADFNLAAELEGTHAYTSAFFTSDYTPPELTWAEVGERGRQVRPTADVWAFGVLAHRVLTGTLPFPGATPSARWDTAARYARGDEELRLSPALPPAWQAVVLHCLARGHSSRAGWDSAELLRRAQEAATAPAHERPRERRRWARAGPTVAACAVAVLGATALLRGEAPTGRTGGTGDTPSPTTVSATPTGASELRTDTDIPVEYRGLILDAAHACGEDEVSPALIAALLKAESDFDPSLSDPAMDEYGIARWTPRVLQYWVTDAERPERGTIRPPFPPEVSIPAVGRYLCHLAPRIDSGIPGSRQVLIAAAYRTSETRVNDAGGVPEEYLDYASRVARHLKEYQPEAAR